MPRAVIQILFITPRLFCNPKLKVYFSVYTDALIELLTSVIGYEAVLADISFSIKSFENLGFKIKFSGYNDKLISFVSIFLDTMVTARHSGFDALSVEMALEKSLKSYRNLNVEVD